MQTTALTTAETAFGFLTCPPAPLALDARPIGGLPDKHLPLDELRQLLISRATTVATSDEAWRQLAAHAREWGPAWVVGAVGVALPGLTRLAAELTRGRPGTAEDVDSEILAGFLHQLRTDDLNRPGIWTRWCWAAWRAGLAALRTEDTVELPADLPAGTSTPRVPYGHPDLILGRAAAAGILTTGQAELIGDTRLGGILIDTLAAAEDTTPAALRMRRRRAERTLATALANGDLGGGGLRTGRPTPPASQVIK